MNPKKSLGQHWLKDEPTLELIASYADLSNSDTVLEIGPGLGSLTRHLLKKASRVIAVELDQNLAAELVREFAQKNLEVAQGDILKFDLTRLPPDYKIVANIPYYLTSNLIRVLSQSANPPAMMVLLVQKEVARRIAAAPGDMSLLSVSTQLYYEPKLGRVVTAGQFEPPPKVDSQVIILTRRDKALFTNLDAREYLRIVKAGFAGRRKKLRGSLSAGLGVSKQQAEAVLKMAGIDANLRAQQLSLPDWHKLYLAYKKVNMELS